MTQETPRAGGPPEAGVPRSLLLGPFCRVQGSHVAGGRDQVDDADEGFHQGDRGGDPQSQPEKAHGANCGEGARAKLRKWGAGEGEGPRLPGQARTAPSSARALVAYLQVPRRS